MDGRNIELNLVGAGASFGPHLDQGCSEHQQDEGGRCSASGELEPLSSCQINCHQYLTSTNCCNSSTVPFFVVWLHSTSRQALLNVQHKRWQVDISVMPLPLHEVLCLK